MFSFQSAPGGYPFRLFATATASDVPAYSRILIHNGLPPPWRPVEGLSVHSLEVTASNYDHSHPVLTPVYQSKNHGAAGSRIEYSGVLGRPFVGLWSYVNSDPPHSRWRFRQARLNSHSNATEHRYAAVSPNERGGLLVCKKTELLIASGRLGANPFVDTRAKALTFLTTSLACAQPRYWTGTESRHCEELLPRVDPERLLPRSAR